MKIPPYFEQGKESMVDLLSSFQIVDDPVFIGRKNYALETPKIHPSFVASGSNALVFGLPPVQSEGKTIPLVGKIFMYLTQKTWEGVPPGVFHLIGNPSGLYYGDCGLAVALHWLEKMNLDSTIPPMAEYFYSFGKKERLKTIFFTIMPDLRENGYLVEEANPEVLERLRNGKDLASKMNEDCNRILSAKEKLGLTIKPADHGSEKDLLPAIEHLFLVQHNGEEGRLFLGDLNHIAIYEKGHQFGRKPSYLD